MNNQLTKGQIINKLMLLLPVVNPFEMDAHLLDVIEVDDYSAYVTKHYKQSADCDC